MTNHYRAAVAVLCFVALVTVPVLIFGSALTRVLFVLALLGAGSLIYLHDHARDRS